MTGRTARRSLGNSPASLRATSSPAGVNDSMPADSGNPAQVRNIQFNVAFIISHNHTSYCRSLLFSPVFMQPYAEDHLISVTRPMKILLDRRRIAYSITAYQRNYEWGEIQVNTLLDDIDEFVGNDAVGPNKPPFKFLAAILVCDPRNTSLEEFKEKVARGFDVSGASHLDSALTVEIVDGQQRITIIILYAYIQYILHKEYPEATEDLTDEIEKRMVRMVRVSGGEWIKRLVILRRIDDRYRDKIQPLDPEVFTFDTTNMENMAMVLEPRTTAESRRGGYKGTIGKLANQNLKLIHEWFESKKKPGHDHLKYVIKFLEVLDESVYLTATLTINRPLAMQSFVGLNSTMSKATLCLADVAKVILCSGGDPGIECDLLCRWVELEHKFQEAVSDFVNDFGERRANKILGKIVPIKIKPDDTVILDKTAKALFEYYLSIIRCIRVANDEAANDEAKDKSDIALDKYFSTLAKMNDFEGAQDFMENYLEKFADAFLLLTTRQAAQDSNLNVILTLDDHRWLDMFLTMTDGKGNTTHTNLRALLVRGLAEVTEEDELTTYASHAAIFSLALRQSPNPAKRAIDELLDSIRDALRDMHGAESSSDVRQDYLRFMTSEEDRLEVFKSKNCFNFIIQMSASHDVSGEIPRALLFITEWDDIKDAMSYFVQSGLEVEHILPQTAEADSPWLDGTNPYWRLTASPEGHVFSEGQHEFLKNKFGNLTLLSSTQNKLASNDDIATKLRVYEGGTGTVNKTALVKWIRGPRRGIFDVNALKERHFERIEVLYDKLAEIPESAVDNRRVHPTPMLPRARSSSAAPCRKSSQRSRWSLNSATVWVFCSWQRRGQPSGKRCGGGAHGRTNCWHLTTIPLKMTFGTASGGYCTSNRLRLGPTAPKCLSVHMGWGTVLRCLWITSPSHGTRQHWNTRIQIRI